MGIRFLTMEEESYTCGKRNREEALWCWVVIGVTGVKPVNTYKCTPALSIEGITQ